MKSAPGIHFSVTARWMFVLAAVVIAAQTVRAQVTWFANMGAQSGDKARQAMAFLPSELWILAGDSITWTSYADEIHTVTFLKQTTTGASTAGTTRPANGTDGSTGCAGGTQGGTPVTTSGLPFAGISCVNSGPFVTGGTYTVTFPTAGNYKLVCLVHRDMTGVVHVLDVRGALPLPHNQRFYDDLAAAEAAALILDTDDDRNRLPNSSNAVISTGEVVATGGGKQFLVIMRFFPETITVRVGETVEWTNYDPEAPHTVTFGAEPADPTALVGVTNDLDLARHGTLPNSSTANSFSSGFYGAALQDQGPNPPTGPVPQTPLGVTRARVTFTQPGTYHYICALHDELGMKGAVIVLP